MSAPSWTTAEITRAARPLAARVKPYRTTRARELYAPDDDSLAVGAWLTFEIVAPDGSTREAIGQVWSLAPVPRSAWVIDASNGRPYVVTQDPRGFVASTDWRDKAGSLTTYARGATS
jgi:hypothetical protein